MEERILDYLLGELSEEENIRMKSELSSNSALYQEMLETERTLQLLAAERGQHRSEAIPFNLFQAIKNDQVTEPAARQALPIHTRVLAIAASLTILIGVCFGIFKQNEINQLDTQLSETLEKKSELENEFNQMVAAANQQMTKLATYTSNTTRVVPLKSTLDGKDYLGNVYWDQASQSIYFDITNLPHTPKGCTYQLWALINGNPVDAGIIDCHTTDLQLAKTLEGFINDNKAVNGFAVTLEKEGGSPVPTLDKMYLYGEI